jgi:beta-mannosidase
LVTRYTNLPYVHTSPLSNWGKDSLYDHGTQHYWGVWHGKDPMLDFAKKSGRFNAEYGFQSFPEFSTLLRFSDTTEWYLTSSVMKQHQKSYVGNGMMKKHADLFFGPTDDFKTFVYYSQLIQAKGVEAAIIAHRLDFPRCGGTLFWQFNDCWPASTWSSIDYYGNWKALHYRVKESFEPVTVLQSPTKPQEFYFVSDVSESYNSSVICSVVDLTGAVLVQISTEIAVSDRLRMKLFEQELVQWSNQSVVYQFHWLNHLGEKKKHSFTQLAADYQPKEKSFQVVSVALSNIDEHNKRAELIIENESFLSDFWIYSTQNGVRFDSNFSDLLPGKHVVPITFESLPQLSDFQYKFR